MAKILCVCLGNRSRSPMMQAVLQQLVGDAFDVESAGVRAAAAGLPANDRSVLCMAERGIDLSGHVSRWAGDLDLGKYACIICVGDAEAEQVKLLLDGQPGPRVIVANAENGGIPDPFDHGLAGYRTCLSLLDAVMPSISNDILAAS